MSSRFLNPSLHWNTRRQLYGGWVGDFSYPWSLFGRSRIRTSQWWSDFKVIQAVDKFFISSSEKPSTEVAIQWGEPDKPFKNVANHLLSSQVHSHISLPVNKAAERRINVLNNCWIIYIKWLKEDPKLELWRNVSPSKMVKSEEKPPDPSSKSVQEKELTEKTKILNFCGKSFKNFSECARQAPFHTGERPFSCEFCSQLSSYAFKKKYVIQFVIHFRRGFWGC